LTYDEAFRLYDFAPALHVLLDTSGIIVDINQTGCQLLGLPRERLRGYPLRMWIEDDGRRDFLDHLRRCRAETDVVESEMALRAADGGNVRARFYSKRCVYRRREVFATVIVDLTEYTLLDRWRERAEDQRDRAEHEREMARAGEAAKDRLIATVSHELRNPLSPALVAAEVLTTWTGLPERVRHLASVIKRNIEHEARLIDDLLDLAKGTQGKLHLQLRPLDVHQVLVDAVNASTPAAESRSVTIGLDLEAAGHVSQADEGRLRQVFSNVLNNAIKFSNPGGAIVVRTTNDTEEILRVTIHDQGAGIDPQTLEQLFGPFEQQPSADRQRSGLGLGLTISRHIIEAHRGRIWASSPGLGQGATFEIELAVSSAKPADLLPASPGTSGPSEGRSRGKVLIVEDHADSGTLMSMFLSQRGYDVTLAQTLADGLRQLDRGWDVVIADIGLIDGSGLEVARQTRSLLHRPSRLIAVSGYGSGADIAASHQAGFHEHLVKPVDLQKLLSALTGVGVGARSA
jgi:PAS domain S-box-containing protein